MDLNVDSDFGSRVAYLHVTSWRFAPAMPRASPAAQTRRAPWRVIDILSLPTTYRSVSLAFLHPPLCACAIRCLPPPRRTHRFRVRFDRDMARGIASTPPRPTAPMDGISFVDSSFLFPFPLQSTRRHWIACPPSSPDAVEPLGATRATASIWCSTTWRFSLFSMLPSFLVGSTRSVWICVDLGVGRRDFPA